MNKINKAYTILIYLLTVQSIIVRGQAGSLSAQQQTLTNQSERLGVYFRENKGQVRDQNWKPRTDVLYSGETGGLVYHLTAQGLSYQLVKKEEKKEILLEKTLSQNANKKDYSARVPTAIYRVDLTWLGANLGVGIEQGEPLMGEENYYNVPEGQDPALQIKSYSDITYKNIYNGIDLRFYESEDGLLEYDFIVHPGADHDQIKLRINGVVLKTNDRNELILQTPIGDIVEGALRVFQEETEILSAWEINDNVVTIKLKTKYDKTKPLRIDPPVRIWGTYYGGSDGGGDAFGCSVDSAGNVFISGTTTSASNVATVGAHQTVFMGGIRDAFLVKFNSNGVRQWGTYYGGSGDDWTQSSCAIDSSGSLYLAGATTSTTNIATPGSHQPAYLGLGDAFLVKFNNSGIRQWGTYYGGSSTDYGRGCAVNVFGNVYLAGYTQSTGNIATPGAHQTSGGGAADAFLIQFNSSGVRQWGTYYGDSGFYDNARGCAIDNNTGNVYLVGTSESSANISTSLSHQLVFGGASDAFIVQFNNFGIRNWATYYGGVNIEEGASCSVDNNGSVFLSGFTSSNSGISTTGAHQLAFAGAEDAFLVKFNSVGARQWGTYCGGNQSEEARATSIGSEGKVYLAGFTYSSTGISTPTSHMPLFGGAGDAFLVLFDSLGVRQWGTYYGGLGTDYGYSCAYGGEKAVYLVGGTYSTSGIATPGAHQTTGGVLDPFFAKLAECASSVENINAQTCGSYISPSGIYNWVSSGIYSDTLYSFFGCDSIITVNLLIANIDSSLTQTSTSLSSNQNGASYQWLNCNNGYSYIPGETGQTYTPGSAGNYAVEITYGTCVDTSSCYNTFSVGLIENNQDEQPFVGPNPTKGIINIQLHEVYKRTNIIITNVFGQTVASQTFTDTKLITTTISAINGVYFVQVIQNERAMRPVKIIKN